MHEELQPTEQYVEQIWETPPRSEIVELTKAHVQAMEMTDDDLVWVQGLVPVLFFLHVLLPLETTQW